MQYHEKNKVKTLVGLQITFYYFIVYVLALITYFRLSALGLVVETIAPKESAWNTVYIFSGILISTIILILVIKFFRKFPILKIMELFLTVTTISGFSSLFINDYIALIIGLIVIILKELLKNTFVRNMITSVIVGFIGGYIAYSIGTFPIVLLLVIVAIYDYIAVFKTKHMVFLAKGVVDKNTVFTYEIKTNTNQFSVDANKKEDVLMPQVSEGIPQNQRRVMRGKLDLGTGDFALPLIAIMKFTSISWILGVACLLCIILILIATLVYLIDNPKHTALPAIPLQAIIIVVFYVISLMFSL